MSPISPNVSAEPTRLLRTLVASAAAALAVVCTGCAQITSCLYPVTPSTREVEVWQYVVLDSVPPHPSVTVVPMSPSSSDQACADRIMGLLLACGLSVLERPVIAHEVATFDGTKTATGTATVEGHSAGTAASGGGLIGAQTNSEVSGSASTHGEEETRSTRGVDPVSVMTQTNADYVFFVRTEPTGTEAWVKVVRRDNLRVLHAGDVYYAYRLNDPKGPYLTTGQTHVALMKSLLRGIGLLK